MIVLEIMAAIIVITIVVLFIPYWRSVWSLPSGYRPVTPEYNRFGEEIGLEVNPDYEEEAAEEERPQEREAEG